jgi:CO/xanthine dehydrogenase Mo-binding subunit
MDNTGHVNLNTDRYVSGRADEQSPGIGLPLVRFDAPDKVTGREKFAADYYGDDCLRAGVKRAGIPHGKLKGIRVTDAWKTHGVVAVLTHQDVPGLNRQGVVRKDQPVLVDDRIRHAGDAIALVIAEDAAVLEEALSKISFDYEPLDPVFDPEEALRPDTPMIHPDNADGNVLLKGSFSKGSVGSAEDECEVIVEGSFTTQRQEHAFLETECGWAQIAQEGMLTVICSTQTPFRDRAEVAEALGLDPGKVRIIAPCPGGAFGGKDGVTVQTLLGLAALNAAGRPVKMWWSREESFAAGTKRHPARVTYTLGAKKDGTLHYLDAKLLFDTGPYDHLGGVVLALAMEHAGGPYRIPNVSVDGVNVYTNNPVSGAFRGFGVPQVTAAIEQMMDMLAERLRTDPLELRRKNAVRLGDTSCAGTTLTHSTGIGQCLEVLSRHPVWTDRHTWKSAAGSFKRRGVGIAALMHGIGYGPVVPDVANAKIELTTEGKFRVYSGVVDMGQGNASTNVQIACTILNQYTDCTELVLPDTQRTLPSGSASASRCTYTFGNALIIAAEELKQRILNRAADAAMAAGPHEMALLPGKVKNLKTGTEVPLARMAGLLNESERTATGRFRTPTAVDGAEVSPELKLHGFPHTVFSYAAHLARIEVDEITGEVEVVNYVAVCDCGTVMNPVIYEQQVQGAVAQGLGYALTEDMGADTGIITTPDLATYLLPVSADVPDIDTIPVEIHESTGPYGLKGIGEINTNGPLPAISNAVFDACGVRIMQYPITPERLLLVMQSAVARQNRGGSSP